jgi:prepilin-type N-terminal cleavage/methylation domain-containing protein
MPAAWRGDRRNPGMVQNGFSGFSRDTRGFTLIELLLVIAILGVLSTIAVRALSDERRRSFDAQTITFMRNLLTAVETDAPKTVGTWSGTQSLTDYPQLQLNPGMQLLIALDGDGRYQFFLAHQAGQAGYYFWVPGPDCGLEVDDTTVQNHDDSGTVPVASDKIVPEPATMGDIDYVNLRGYLGL